MGPFFQNFLFYFVRFYFDKTPYKVCCSIYKQHAMLAGLMVDLVVDLVVAVYIYILHSDLLIHYKAVEELYNRHK